MKKIFHIFLKIIIFIFTCILILTIAVSLTIKFYGNHIIKTALSTIYKAPISFKNVSFDFKKGLAQFKGFSMASTLNLSETLFNAEKFILKFDRDKLIKNKEFVIEELVVEKGIFTLTRDKTGKINLVTRTEQKNFFTPNLYAATLDNNSLAFLQKIKNCRISNSTFLFRDYYIENGPCVITFKNVNIDFTPLKTVIRFNIPQSRYRDGEVFLLANTPYLNSFLEINILIETKFIDFTNFSPYITKYTPFSLQKALASTITDFRLQNNTINSTTTMTFHELGLYVNQGKENAQFLATSVNKIVPYLRSGKGEIIFDFIIKGPLFNPEIALGPQTKHALGLLMLDEMGNFLKNLQTNN